MLAYRNFMNTDVTTPNIYQFLGNKEEGQGTLCIDEADNIDMSHEIMSLSKNGYTKGFPVARIDTSNGRKQYRYFTFCFKALSRKITRFSKGEGLQPKNYTSILYLRHPTI